MYRVLIAILLSSLTLCLAQGLQAHETIKGSGKITSEKKDIAAFKEINVLGFGILHIKQGDKEALTIEAEDNILPIIESKVDSGSLSLGLKHNVSVSPKKEIHYYLTVKDIDEIKMHGSSVLSIKEPLKLNELNLTLNGSGHSTLALEVKKFTANLAGSGNIQASGNAQEQTMDVHGSGNIDARQLQGRRGKINIYGSGSAEVNVAETLNINIFGSGSVEYRGQPKLTQKVIGSGSINPK